MDKEVRFSQILEEIKRTARNQKNFISEDQLSSAFEELGLSDDRILMVKDYLKSQNISVGDEDVSLELSDEDINYLQMYLDEIDMLPKCTDGEKRAYTIQVMAGEKDAKEKLICCYLGEVTNIAKLYTGQGVYIEDLIGEGNVALTLVMDMLGSQESPDDCEGVIVRYVMDAMEELVKEASDNYDTNKKALDRVNNIFEKADKLSKELLRKVTVDELCELEHLSRKAVIDAIRISGYAIDSIEIPEELKGE